MAVQDIQGVECMAFCHPAQLLSQFARLVEVKDQDRLLFAVPSCPELLAVFLPAL